MQISGRVNGCATLHISAERLRRLLDPDDSDIPLGRPPGHPQAITILKCNKIRVMFGVKLWIRLARFLTWYIQGDMSGAHVQHRDAGRYQFQCPVSTVSPAVLRSTPRSLPGRSPGAGNDKRTHSALFYPAHQLCPTVRYLRGITRRCEMLHLSSNTTLRDMGVAAMGVADGRGRDFRAEVHS